jgi:glycosyltransferase involved in cell wall biosynthesis
MKICLVGPGVMTIPPVGWGAVEILIWDYFNELLNQGHAVNIINKLRHNSREQNDTNSSYCQQLIAEINSGNYDFVHLHYDCLYHILPFLTCKKVGITSHYPYIDQPEKHMADGFRPIYNFLTTNSQVYNFVLAQKDVDFLLKHCSNPNNIIKLENGVNVSAFKFKQTGDNMGRTIYLGKISERKGQNKYDKLTNIDFIGPNGMGLSNWKGEWTRTEVNNNLTQYGNMLLLSNGEADPLVIKEAFAAGLGVVINKTSGKNLLKNEFITIIDDDKMDDLVYIQNAIDTNRTNSTMLRDKIRQFASTNYDWSKILQDYVTHIETIKPLNAINANVTIVTAFFDINRELNGDGRKLDEYLSWIQKTLQLNCNMYIVTEKRFVDFMKKHRPSNYNTYIKEDTLENAHYYKYLPQITTILNSPVYKQRIAHPDRVECKLPEYNIIQYSKFGWLENAIADNPFHTEYFFWMDAGCSRFFSDTNIQDPYPGKNIIRNSANKFIIQARRDIFSYPIDNNFIWKADNLLVGTLFGGYYKSIGLVKRLLEDVFNNDMLKHNNVNNEQLGLALVYKKYPDLFRLYVNTTSTHLPLFVELRK